jgi:hypothetical protein
VDPYAVIVSDAAAADIAAIHDTLRRVQGIAPRLAS